MKLFATVLIVLCVVLAGVSTGAEWAQFRGPGGLGGFLLPTCFGWLKDFTGTFSAGFFVFGLVSGFAALSVMIVQRSTRFDRPNSVSET